MNAQLDLMHTLQLLQIRIVSLDTHRLTLLTTHNTTTLSLSNNFSPLTTEPRLLI